MWWRDALQVHPAAELFPPMSPDQLKALGEDILKNGLTSPIALWRADPKAQAQLLDGRNRLDSIEVKTGKPVIVGPPSLTSGEDFLALEKVIVLDGKKVDPYGYVISANIRRRHLSAEDKDRLIIQLLKADPTKSNRQVAKLTDTSHPHVARVREQAESTGDVETVTTSVDTKGRKQPSGKTRKAGKSQRQTAKALGVGEATVRRDLRQGDAKGAPERRTSKAEQRDDIGPTSTSEIARRDFEIEQLHNEKQQLKIKITGLESEIEEAKAAAPPAERKSLAEKLEPLIETLFEQGLASATAAAPPVVMAAVVKLERLLVEHGIMLKSRRYEDPQAYARALKAKTARQWKKEHPPKADSHATPPPSDDGLDLPECLRRSASS